MYPENCGWISFLCLKHTYFFDSFNSCDMFRLYWKLEQSFSSCSSSYVNTTRQVWTIYVTPVSLRRTPDFGVWWGAPRGEIAQSLTWWISGSNVAHPRSIWTWTPVAPMQVKVSSFLCLLLPLQANRQISIPSFSPVLTSKWPHCFSQSDRSHKPDNTARKVDCRLLEVDLFSPPTEGGGGAVWRTYFTHVEIAATTETNQKEQWSADLFIVGIYSESLVFNLCCDSGTEGQALTRIKSDCFCSRITHRHALLASHATLNVRLSSYVLQGGLPEVGTNQWR